MIDAQNSKNIIIIFVWDRKSNIVFKLSTSIINQRLGVICLFLLVYYLLNLEQLHVWSRKNWKGKRGLAWLLFTTGDIIHFIEKHSCEMPLGEINQIWLIGFKAKCMSNLNEVIFCTNGLEAIVCYHHGDTYISFAIFC